MSIDLQSNYYDIGGIEVNDVIRAKLTREQYIGWLMASVIKYACRANFKHDTPKRDVEKAGVYLGLLKEELEKNG